MKFNNPTLVTITSPTASGKSYLLNQMVGSGAFARIVSTTTRTARPGEVEGVDYYFIDEVTSRRMEANDEFFELITFNGVRYGVTLAEMLVKMAPGAPPPVVILEPQGLDIYTRKCYDLGWDIFKIYVHVPEPVRLSRLLQRTLKDAWAAVDDALLGTGTVRPSRYADAFAATATDAAKTRVAKAITSHHQRLVGVEEERRWSNVTTWDTIVPGDDVEKAIEMIEQGVRWRNQRRAAPRAIGAVELPL